MENLKFEDNNYISLNENEKEIFKNKGLLGMANLGNTCYINSLLAILSHTYELNKFLFSTKYNEVFNKKKPESIVLTEWKYLLNLIWNSETKKGSGINPVRFIKIFRSFANFKKREEFAGFYQNDISELFIFLIDIFHTSLSREIKVNIKGNIENDTDEIAKNCYELIKRMYSKEYSEIWNLFSGILVTQIFNKDKSICHSSNPDPYFSIELPVPKLGDKQIDLIDCLEEYTKDELLEGENNWYNEKTKKREDIVKNIRFWSLPSILCIVLKRFNNNASKKQNLVKFPVTEKLDLNKFCIGYEKSKYKYTLYGVGNHIGSSDGGHNTAFVKNIDDEWYFFNDLVVKKVNAEQIITPMAYCLFYRRCD